VQSLRRKHTVLLTLATVAGVMALAAVSVVSAQRPTSFPLPVEIVRALVELRSSADVQVRRLAISRVVDFVLKYPSRELRNASPELLNTLLATIHDGDWMTQYESFRALAHLRRPEATKPLGEFLLKSPVGDAYGGALNALAMSEDPAVEAIFRQLAAASPDMRIRRSAAGHLLSRAPVEGGGIVRDVLYERADTDLERNVLARGRDWLPQTWRVLESGTPAERRVAAALLAFVRSDASVPYILKAFDGTADPELRQQLAFALGMIAITEGRRVEDLATRDALARSFTDDVMADARANMSPLIGSELRMKLGLVRRISVSPNWTSPTWAHRVSGPISSPDRSVSAPALDAVIEVAASVAAHQEWISTQTYPEHRWGIRFRGADVVGDVARVSATVRPRGEFAAVYRRVGGRWVPLYFHPFDRSHDQTFGSNLFPSILRDYGVLDPPLIAQVHDRMTDIAAVPDDGAAQVTDITFGYGVVRATGGRHPLQRDEAALVTPYRASASRRVRQAVEIALAELDDWTDLPFWIDVIETERSESIKGFAVERLAREIERRIAAEGQPFPDGERDALMQSALRTIASGPGSTLMLEAKDVVRVRMWRGMAVVEFAFGSGPRGGSGFTEVWVRADRGWRLLTATRSWIS
jgi:hypothetical protein